MKFSTAFILALAAALLFLSVSRSGQEAAVADEGKEVNKLENGMEVPTEEITLGGGCFWCIDAVFQAFRGVVKVESGYAGGLTPNPSYESVSGGATGHAEVVRVEFDPKEISLEQLLTVFFHAHDPTTMNRQGNDVGPQYRSIILYSSEEQRKVATEVKQKIQSELVWGEKSLVTELQPLKEFHLAEDYHQNYYEGNKSKGYCQLVIAPKIQKIRKEFASRLK